MTRGLGEEERRSEDNCQVCGSDTWMNGNIIKAENTGGRGSLIGKKKVLAQLTHL